MEATHWVTIYNPSHSYSVRASETEPSTENSAAERCVFMCARVGAGWGCGGGAGRGGGGGGGWFYGEEGGRNGERLPNEHGNRRVEKREKQTRVPVSVGGSLLSAGRDTPAAASTLHSTLTKL